MSVRLRVTLDYLICCYFFRLCFSRVFWFDLIFYFLILGKAEAFLENKLIQKERLKDRNTEREKDRKTERQINRKTNLEKKDRETEIYRDRKQKNRYTKW